MLSAEEALVFLRELEFEEGQPPSAVDIKKRWKELCRKHHPDVGGNEEKFHSITHAYKMLTDLEYRVKQKPMESKNLDLRIQIPITFEEAFAGVRLKVNFNVVNMDDNWDPVRPEGITETETLDVHVPPGSFELQPLEFLGKGFTRNGARGTTFIMTQVKPHPRFKVQRSPNGGWDIHSQEEIPLFKMLTGGMLEIVTMKGVKSIKVPPGSKPNDQLYVDKGGCNGGRHVVTIVPIFPKKDELKSDQWKGLGIDWGNEPEEDEEEVRYMNTFGGVRLKVKKDGSLSFL